MPVSFTYTNGNGEKFLVININPRENDILMRHYARGYQYCKFMSDNYYAFCPGHPDLYLLCYTDGKNLVVGVWNFCIDPAQSPVVYLGDKYSNIRFIKGQGNLCGQKVEMEEIPPYGFSGFVLNKD